MVILWGERAASAWTRGSRRGEGREAGSSFLQQQLWGRTGLLAYCNSSSVMSLVVTTAPGTGGTTAPPPLIPFYFQPSDTTYELKQYAGAAVRLSDPAVTARLHPTLTGAQNSSRACLCPADMETPLLLDKPFPSPPASRLQSAPPVTTLPPKEFPGCHSNEILPPTLST